MKEIRQGVHRTSDRPTSHFRQVESLLFKGLAQRTSKYQKWTRSQSSRAWGIGWAMCLAALGLSTRATVRSRNLFWIFGYQLRQYKNYKQGALVPIYEHAPSISNTYYLLEIWKRSAEKLQVRSLSHESPKECTCLSDNVRKLPLFSTVLKNSSYAAGTKSSNIWEQPY
jgi:hypothetical protein